MSSWLPHIFYCRVAVSLVLALSVSSCGTGIEVTEHVTDKDVHKVMDKNNHVHIQPVTLEAYADSVPAWRPGQKRFWVTDNQVRLLFDGGSSDLASHPIAGHVLVYDGYETGSLYDDRMTINLKFVDSDNGESLLYRTGKTLEEFGRGFSIPMMIDMDMVEHIAQQVVGKQFYIRSSIWYDRENEQMINGRHFIQVHIDDVKPGNSVMPLRVLFTTTDTQQRAMVWMNGYSSAIPGRDFDSLFDESDPHLNYPTISAAHWQLITQSQVIEGMTKEECRLAMGSPNRISQNPDQGGMREYWYYEGGSYLFFIDGLLSQFRI